jgi:hypothetical protein
MSDHTDDDYGFVWGPATVTRLSTIPSGKGELYVLGVDSEHHAVQVSVSRTGRSVRVWRDGKELT